MDKCIAMLPRTSSELADIEGAAEPDEFALDGEVEELDLLEGLNPGTQATLLNLEAETDLYKQVADLADKTLQAQLQKPADKGADESPPKEVIAKPAQPAATMPLTLARILENADLPAYKALEDTDIACISRVKKLFTPVQRFIRAVREEEGFAPRAALEQEGEQLNQHNWLQRRLAHARQEFELSGARRSRMQMWMHFAGKCVQAAQGSVKDSEPAIHVPQCFKPSCILKASADKDQTKRDYQILCARTCADDKLRLVLVQRVFRGAAKKTGMRSKRATKPHYGILPAIACAKVQACVLIPDEGDGCFYVSNVCRLQGFEVGGPEHNILCEIPSSHFNCVQDENLILRVKFSAKVPKMAEGWVMLGLVCLGMIWLCCLFWTL